MSCLIKSNEVGLQRGIIKMSDNVTETQEATVTLTVEQLEQIIRKVVREELMEFTTQDFFDLDKDSLLYQDLEDIFKREKNESVEMVQPHGRLE